MAAGEIVVINGVRWRFEEATARGLIGERPVPKVEDVEKAPPANKSARPKNKSRRPATKDK